MAVNRAWQAMAVCVAVCLAIGGARPLAAYVEIPYTLARLVGESTHVMVVRVEKVDKEKNLIIYTKVKDIKGTHPETTIRHNIGRAGFHPREWQTIMAWAEPGKTAVFMHNGGASETCIDGYWYQAYPGGEWWNMSHGEPYLLRTYAGKPDKLATAVAQLLAGQEVVVPCMVDGDKAAIQEGRARVQRLKAKLGVMEYDAKRDFVGWGGNEDFRRLAGMPGFSHYGGIAQVSPQAGGVAPADFDGDGKIDFCLYGAGRVVLLQNDGKTLNEVSLPIVGGARWAGWADYNGDKLPDLLVATPHGPRLFTNKGGNFQDDTGGLPYEPYYNVTAAAWIDADVDGRPDILLGNGFLGLKVYRNLGPEAQAAAASQPAIGKWHYCGPFDNTGGQGFAAEYPPEKGPVDLKAKYAGKGGEPAVWKEGNFADGQPNSLAIFARPEHNNDVAVYLYREFLLSAAMELPASFGSDDTLTVWLNEQKIISENVSRAVAPDQHLVTLKLRPGKNRLLLKICQGTGEFGFYFAGKGTPTYRPPLFADASDKFLPGLPALPKGDHLAVADVNGDNRPDFLYSAGTGILCLNTPQGFVPQPQAGIAYRAGGVAPVFGDFDGDQFPDLFVPQATGSKLYRNAGGGKFADVTAASGDLARLPAGVTSATWAVTAGGKQCDLYLGCVRGPNRYLRHAGGGKFTDATRDLGLHQRVFNTRGLCAVDVNGDGVLDIVFNNEGQESVVLLGSAPSTAMAGGQ